MAVVVMAVVVMAVVVMAVVMAVVVVAVVVVVVCACHGRLPAHVPRRWLPLVGGTSDRARRRRAGR